MNDAIKVLLETNGWKYVEEMFHEAIMECNTEDVNQELNATSFKQNVLANRKAAKKIEALLNKIKKTGLSLKTETISYK
jgi:ppGpp synthetase/RelA/SpoT-type nucleotidyltranferase